MYVNQVITQLKAWTGSAAVYFTIVPYVLFN